MSDSPFSKPRRQELLGIIILYAKNVRRFVNLILAFAVGTSYIDSIPFGFKGLLIVGALLLVVFTVFEYLRFKFYIQGEELVLNRGVFKREQLRIPFDRIQTVHLTQNLIQQVLRISGLRIDTAGSGKQELKITALTLDDAKALKVLLQNAQAEPSVTDSETMSEREEPKSKTLVQLNLKKLAIVGLTENHIRSGFVAMGILFAYWWQLKELLGEDYSEQIESGAENINAGFESIQSNVQWLVILLLVFLLGAVMMSVGRIVFRYFGFDATMKGKSLHVESGLLRRNEYSIPLSKIQMLVWQGNFLRRIPGFESVLIKQSKSDDSSRKLNVEIPSIYAPESAELLQAVFQKRSSNELPKFTPHAFYSFYIGARYLLIGLILISIAYFKFQTIVVVSMAAVYSALVIFYSKQYFKRVELRTDGELLEFKKGWLFNNRVLLRSFKLQSVKMKQSVFQKRRGTAHLVLYTAGGSLRLPFMPEQLVHELYNYFLYKIETSKEPWM